MDRVHNRAQIPTIEVSTNCRACHYWDVGNERNRPHMEKAPCRRNAPAPGRPPLATGWPLTSATDWCGDHKEIE